MDSFPSRVQQFIERENLFTRQDRLLVAVSGGLDSCVLTQVLHNLGYSLALAHCNYRLRGSESDADADLVKGMSDDYGVILHSAVTPPPDPVPLGFNLQSWARTVRYDHFKKILNEYSYQILVTAHHLDDNLETQVFHLLRGTGLSGLRGIPVSSSFPLARPLLETPRAEILEYALSEGLQWREDRSNASDAYARNRIRHRLIPLLREMGLTDRGARGTFRHLRSAGNFYVAALADHPAVQQTGGEIVISRNGHGLSREDLVTLLWFHGKRTGFTEDQYRQMVNAPERFMLRSETHIARVNPATITLCRQEPEVPEAQVIEALPYSADFGTYRISIDEVNHPDDLQGIGVHYCRCVDYPLILRSRAPGDTFAPLGMGGRHKTIKDLLIDRKLAPWEKDLVPLLLDASGEIVCVVGYRIADPYAVSDGDARVLRILYEKRNPGSRR